MKKFTIYIHNTRLLDVMLAEITDQIPCFINREYAGGKSFSKIEVACREEDYNFVATRLSAAILLS